MADLDQVLQRLDRIEGKLDARAEAEHEDELQLALLDKRVSSLEATDLKRQESDRQVTLWQGGLALLGGLAMLFGAIAAVAKVFGLGSK